MIFASALKLQTTLHGASQSRTLPHISLCFLGLVPYFQSIVWHSLRCVVSFFWAE